MRALPIYHPFCPRDAPQEVSEGPTGACICAEKRLSVLRYAKASFEVQRQVPVGPAASGVVRRGIPSSLRIEQNLVVGGHGPRLALDDDLHLVHGVAQGIHHRHDLVGVHVRALLLIGYIN